jgi:hypothetical protein
VTLPVGRPREPLRLELRITGALRSTKGELTETVTVALLVAMAERGEIFRLESWC